MRKPNPFWIKHDKDQANREVEMVEPSLEETEGWEVVSNSWECIDWEFLAEGGNGYE